MAEQESFGLLSLSFRFWPVAGAKPLFRKADSGQFRCIRHYRLPEPTVSVSVSTFVEDSRYTLAPWASHLPRLITPKIGSVSTSMRPTVACVSNYCIELTGIDPVALAHGVSFVDACAWLHADYGAASAWASFGHMDCVRLRQQCDREGVPFPLPNRHIDIQRIATRHFGWWRRRGLLATLHNLDLALDGAHHNALSDAINAAKILAALPEVRK